MGKRHDWQVVLALLVSAVAAGCARQAGAPSGPQTPGGRVSPAAGEVAPAVGQDEAGGANGGPSDAGPSTTAAPVGEPAPAGGTDGGEELTVIGGPRITEEQLGDLRTQLEGSLTLESILGGTPDAVGDEPGSSGVGISSATDGPVPGLGSSSPPDEEWPGAATAERRGSVRAGPVRPVAGRELLGGDEFREVLGRRVAAIERCYEDALAEQPELEGAATWIVGIDDQGRAAVELQQADQPLVDAGVTACVAARLATMRFRTTPPEGSEVRVELPLRFVLREEEP
jgi:hypothetical protein